MRKSITAVIVGFCLVVTTLFSFNLFSCFGEKEKEFTFGDNFSITLTSRFKSQDFDDDDFASDDPVTQGQMFKYLNSTDGILVVGARASKEDCKKLNAFDLDGFVKVVKILYDEQSAKVTYNEEGTYFAEFHFNYGDGLLQYETCYEDERYFYEISYSMDKNDYFQNDYDETVKKYAQSVKTPYNIAKYDSVKESSFTCDGIEVAFDETFKLDETKAFYTNGVMEISAISTRSDDPEEQVTIESLDQMEEVYETLLNDTLVFERAKTKDNVSYSYATIGDGESGVYAALYVFDGIGYIVTYTVEYDYFDWFYSTMHSFARGVKQVA